MRPLPLAAPAVARGRFALLAALAIGGIGCKDDSKSTPHGSPPPPPPIAAASGSAGGVAACDPNAIGFGDPRTANVLPTTIAGFCALKTAPVQAWGDGTSKDVKDIADAIDGAGEIYVRNYFAKRFEIARFSDARGTLAEVEVWVSTFDKPESAYGLYTYRVVSNVDPDPDAAAKAKRRAMKPIPASGAAALGNAQALLWKGNFLIEMTYNADPTKSAAQATAEADALLPQFARAIGDKILGSTELPLDVRLLPSEQEGRIPLGVDYVPPKFVRPEGKGDALKITIPGGYAMAYVKDPKDGGKRYRVIAVARDEVDAARDAMASFQKLPGAVVMKVDKETADDAWAFPFAVGSGGPGADGKAEGVVMRKGRIVLAVMDEELALGDAAVKEGWPRLSKEEKVGKLRGLLAGRHGPPGPGKEEGGGGSPSPSASASASASGSASGGVRSEREEWRGRAEGEHARESERGEGEGRARVMEGPRS